LTSQDCREGLYSMKLVYLIRIIIRQQNIDCKDKWMMFCEVHCKLRAKQASKYLENKDKLTNHIILVGIWNMPVGRHDLHRTYIQYQTNYT
jgi:hypothetical protein